MYPSNSKELMFGGNDVLSLLLTIENKRENAFLPTVSVDYSNDLVINDVVFVNVSRNNIFSVTFMSYHMAETQLHEERRHKICNTSLSFKVQMCPSSV